MTNVNGNGAALASFVANVLPAACRPDRASMALAAAASMGPVSAAGPPPGSRCLVLASWYNSAKESCSAASSGAAFPCVLASAPDSRSMWA